MIQKIQCSCLLAVLLLFTPSCLHRRAVVFEHDTLTGRDTMTYRGKTISPEELFELGEKTDFGRIDLIMKKDGTKQKLDFKAWHTGLRLIPEMMQGGAVE